MSYNSVYTLRIFERFLLDIFIGKHKIYWEDDDMEYSGTPFIVANRKLLDCHHGKDRNTRAKIKLKEKSAQEKVRKFHQNYFLVVYWCYQQRVIC